VNVTHVPLYNAMYRNVHFAQTFYCQLRNSVHFILHRTYWRRENCIFMKLFLSSFCPSSSCTHFPSYTSIIVSFFFLFSLFNYFSYPVLAANAGICVLISHPTSFSVSNFIRVSVVTSSLKCYNFAP